MRNGNEENQISITDEMQSSYRTYEEWKPGLATLSVLSELRSYRTYEEWKLILPTPPLHG